jgi:hypothetical protein
MRHLCITALLLFLTLSCQKEELQYSCNPEIDRYVTANLDQLAKLSLDEFLEQSIPLQRAVFRSYTAEKKLECWIEKLDRTLLLENWSETEVLHIKKLENNLDTSCFETVLTSDTIDPEIQLFVKRWIEYSLNTLKWNKPKLAFVISSLYYSLAEFNQALAMELNQSIPVSDCGCSIEMDFCSYQYYLSCKSSDCTASSSGCGWLWGDACDGTCQQVQE